MMPSVHLPTSYCKHQHGGAMLVMLVILVMGITTAFITSLSSTAISNKRHESSADALAQAKEALIGYAVIYGDTNPAKPHGMLPCPDTDGSSGANPEGSSEFCGNTNVNKLGRLPWRTLDLPALFDGSSECLWYAVSGNYKNTLATPPTMNWDNPGQLHVYDSNNNEISSGEIVAVVIAPGPPLSSNADRTGSSAPTCSGNYTASAYLDNDTVHSKNNADITQASFILPHVDSNTVSTNDQIVYITRQDIWKAIQKRIAREAKKCLDEYAATAGNKYPMATSTSTASFPTLFGRIPATPDIRIQSQRNLDMVSSFETLIPLLIAFRDNRTFANFNAIDSHPIHAAATAENKADTVKDWYDSHPVSDPTGQLENAARTLRNAAETAKNWNSWSWPSTSSINSLLNVINQASATFSNNLPLDSMPAAWPNTCTLFSSTSWTNWQDLIFYQLADGFKPGTSPACGSAPNTCLSIEGSGHTTAGSGTYRAVVIAAGKNLTPAPRVPQDPSTYLEPDNLLPKENVANPYKTYHFTDAASLQNNDIVLCLDGYTPITHPAANCK